LSSAVFGPAKISADAPASEILPWYMNMVVALHSRDVRV
jgi:hypothetical protein